MFPDYVRKSEAGGMIVEALERSLRRGLTRFDDGS